MEDVDSQFPRYLVTFIKYQGEVSMITVKDLMIKLSSRLIK